MTKAFWISFFQEIRDGDKLAAYGKLAAPAIAAGGGVYLARSVADLAYEGGKREHVTLIEFPSLAAARATHESGGYQSALAALADGAIRDHRLVTAL